MVVSFLSGNCSGELLDDPALGRFLMPDPLIQDPASTQNYNRYSYCLNKPLKYTDENGEFVGTILTAVLRGVASIFGSAYKAIEGGIDNGWKGAWDGFSGEWKQYGRRVANAAKIDWGLFRTDSHRSIPGQILSIVSRLSWELPQTVLGNVAGHFRNNFWRTNVEYYREATLINRYGKDYMTPGETDWGFTLGSYINGKNLEADPQVDDIFGHEYGHVKQSNAFGLLYLPLVGVPSLIGSAFDGVWNHDHNNEWYEVWANKEANRYFMEIGDTTAAKQLVSGSNKLVRSKPDWYDYVIWIYYFLLCFGIGFI
jgi:hypothetical protein